MPREIGRLDAYGLGIETTSGTAVPATVFFPVKGAKLTPKVETVKDDSGRGVIDSTIDANVTQVSSEFTASGVVRAQSIGHILLMTLGQVSAPVLAETGVFTHSFTRKNTNQHPSATLYVKQGVGDELATYCMLDSFSLKAEVGEYAMFDVSMMGRGATSTTGVTPAYPLSDETFVVSRAYVKTAPTLAGLATASRVGMKSVNFEVTKNLEQTFETRRDSVVDATDFSSQENKNFEVSGDFEMVLDSTTYRELAKTAGLQAIEITLEGKTLIGATKYNTLTFRFPQVVIEDWDRSDGNDDIVTQSFGFTALYSLADSMTMDATLTNTKSTTY